MADRVATSATDNLPQLAGEMTRRVVSVRWPLGADRSAVVGLLAASLAFYYPLVFLGRALVDYDAFVYFYPQRVYLAQSLLAGRIPLWDPDLFLGVPFLANPQTAVLYPTSGVLMIGPRHGGITAPRGRARVFPAVFYSLLGRTASRE